MNDALIGYTGFVGSTLARQRHFDAQYNSRNIAEMAGKSFDTVYCAGVQSVKWLANKDPQKDQDGIEALSSVLKMVKAKRFILISTIDVYPVTNGADESFDCHGKPNHPYGMHRLIFEDFCAEQFADCTVVRLPGLFGQGLKKNVIYDLLNDNCLENINQESSFQYYDLTNLNSDIERTLKHQVRLINLFTEPLKTKRIIDAFFPGKIVGQKAGAEAHYDLYTRYGSLWQQSGNYLMNADAVMKTLGHFIGDYRKAA